MSNVLAAQGHVVLPDGNYPDVTWMIEGIEVEVMSEQEIENLVEAQAALFNEYNPSGEVADADNIDQAKMVIKKIWRQRQRQQ